MEAEFKSIQRFVSHLWHFLKKAKIWHFVYKYKVLFPTISAYVFNSRNVCLYPYTK